MSYILDALKKADQERKLSRTPDLMTEQEKTLRKKGKHPVLYVIIVMFVAAGGAAGWYLGHEENIPVQKTGVSLARPPIQSAEVKNDKGSEKNAAVALKETPAQLPTENPARNKTMAQEAIKPEKKKQSAIKPDAEKASGSGNINDTSTPAASRESAQPAAKKKPDNRIYAISELPEEIRQGLPSLSISTHIYSPEKTERLASINGHIGREGQEITAGIVLDSVTPDGVILRYQGYRFSVGLR